MCVCVRVRERVREREYVCERESDSVCVRERERVSAREGAHRLWISWRAVTLFKMSASTWNQRVLV